MSVCAFFYVCYTYTYDDKADTLIRHWRQLFIKHVFPKFCVCEKVVS